MQIVSYGEPRTATTLLFNMITVCYFLYLAENDPMQAPQLTYSYTGEASSKNKKPSPNVIKTNSLDLAIGKGLEGDTVLVFSTATDKKDALALATKLASKSSVIVAHIHDTEMLQSTGVAGMIRVFVEGFGLASEAEVYLLDYFSAWEILRHAVEYRY